MSYDIIILIILGFILNIIGWIMVLEDPTDMNEAFPKRRFIGMVIGCTGAATLAVAMINYFATLG